MRRIDKECIEEVEEIIQKADVCRIAFANGDIPYIVTMNFGYTDTPGRRLYFHCADAGRKLEMIRKNNYVCFEMDIDHKLYQGEKACDWGMKYRSVVGYGNITIVTEAETKKTGLNCIMTHYGGEGDHLYDVKVLEKTTILQLDIKEMSGKKC
jgi:nitroimidazol reductase NimA-like FMN-containing flavoprotein (pyridoxamine 5'-phosphate oxidase superfamily)